MAGAAEKSICGWCGWFSGGGGGWLLRVNNDDGPEIVNMWINNLFILTLPHDKLLIIQVL